MHIIHTLGPRAVNIANIGLFGSLGTHLRLTGAHGQADPGKSLNPNLLDPKYVVPLK